MTEDRHTPDLEGRFTLHATQAIDDAKAIYERDPDALWAGEFVVAAVDALSRLHGLVDDDD